jgi:hypothetical protein
MAIRKRLKSLRFYSFAATGAKAGSATLAAAWQNHCT